MPAYLALLAAIVFAAFLLSHNSPQAGMPRGQFVDQCLAHGGNVTFAPTPEDDICDFRDAKRRDAR
jgi:hypothetical protein